MQICLKFNVFALQNFLGGHHHKSAPSTPRNPDEDQRDISALEREKVNKAIEFMFVGINMFWVQLRLILAQANLGTIWNELWEGPKIYRKFKQSWSWLIGNGITKIQQCFEWFRGESL